MKQDPSTYTEAQIALIVSLLGELMPRVLPADWRVTRAIELDARWLHSTDGLAVCFGIELVDGDPWIHVSMSRQRRDPSYFDLVRVKNVFIGPQRKAVLVLPPAAEHYSLHPHCLHLYCKIDGDPLPDFRNRDGSI